MIFLLTIVSLAAMLNAVMDILENENFSSSVFRNLNPKFWYKRESWKHARKIFGYKLDAWHLVKSAMVMLLLAQIADSFSQWVMLGLAWNLSFSLTYKWLKGWTSPK